MAQYDGSIRILTKIFTEMAEKSLGTLSQTIKGTAKEIISLRSKMNALKGQKIYPDDYKNLQKDLTSAEKSLDGFYGKLREMEKGKGFTGTDVIKKEEAELRTMEKELFRLVNIRDHLPSSAPELGSANQAVSDYEKKVNSLREKLEKQLATNEKIKNSAPYQKVNADIEIYQQKVDELRANIEELKESGKDFTMGEKTQEYANYERQLQNEEEALRKAQELQKVVQSTDDPYARLSQSLGDLNRILSIVLHPIESLKSSFASAAESMKAKAAGMAASIINGINLRIRIIEKRNYLVKMYSGLETVNLYHMKENILVKKITKRHPKQLAILTSKLKMKQLRMLLLLISLEMFINLLEIQKA